MKYIGLHTQIQRNNRRSILLLLGFPSLILLGVYLMLLFVYWQNQSIDWATLHYHFVSIAPMALLFVGVWFVIAFFFHTQMIKHATHSHTLSRKENMRVYNLTENLCMSVGMKMPKLFIIETNALNAFASGINEKTYAVTLTRGIINRLNDEELEGVIAHELTHIRNKDVRLLIVSIVFVGIFALIVNLAFRSILHSGSFSRRRDEKGGAAVVMLVILLIAVVIYFFSMIFKFALSRKREYLADAGAVQMTKNSQALANALRKISGRSQFETSNDEVRELFIDNGNQYSSGFLSSISNIFATHPPIEKRIAVLEKW